MRVLCASTDREAVPAVGKKLYQKPLLRELVPGEHAAARETLQDFHAQMEMLGARPSQESFELYLKNRSKK